jgi:small-conductance mechanosensitive channel
MIHRLAALLLLSLGLVVAAPPGLLAQEPAEATQGEAQEAIDYQTWEAEAARAENLLEAGTASTAFFENLRATLVEWRSRFLAAETANSARIETIRAQIEALGPPPEEGATEPDGIAERREDLNDQLARAQEPQLNAAAAFTRADGLINEIDALLRERQQQQLLQLDPSPANPVNWPAAIVALRDVSIAVERQVATRLNDRVRREELVDNAPGIAVLTLVGLLAIARGRPLTTRLTERLHARMERRTGRIAVAFLVSLLQVVVPLAGVILLLTALLSTGMIGSQARSLAEALGGMAVAVYSSLWLAGRLFRADEDTVFATLRSEPKRAAAARQVTVWIGITVGLGIVVQTIAGFDQVSPAAHGVIQMPVYLVLGYLFWRAARLLRTDLPAAEAEESRGFGGRAVALTSTALVVLAVAGPVLGLIGYVNAAEAVMVPAAQSLGLVGILLALQPVVRDLYALIFRTTPEDAAAALLPVLVNFLLIFAALPLFALLWGMRPDQLGDVYGRFWEGIALGDVRLTPGAVFAVIVVFALGLIATRLLQGALRTTVLPRTRLDPGARNAITSGIGYVGIGLAAVIAITSAGIDLTALGVVIGALSVGIGFGLQNVVNNFVSGIILLIERPISEGDWIEVNGMMGIVKSISVRSTRIETFDKTDVIVPNADFISGTVTNWTRGNTVGRAVITVGVAYGTDTRRVQEILLEIAREHPVVAAFPEPGVDFLGFGADSLDFRIRAILRDVNQLLSVKTEINHRIAERFAEEGIEIPFAQRDVWLRNPETLFPDSGARAGSDAAAAPRPADPPGSNGEAAT